MTIRTIIFASGLAVAIGLFSGCEQKSSKPTPSATPSYSPRSGDYGGSSYPGGSAGLPSGGYGSQSFGSNGGVDIREISSGAFGDVLLVQQGQTVTWQFQAYDTSGTGTTPQIVSITPQPYSASMQISGNSVTFRPNSQAELQGVLTVVASTSGAGGINPGINGGISGGFNTIPGVGVNPDPYSGLNSGGGYPNGFANPGLQAGSSYGSAGYSGSNGQFTKQFRWQSGNGIGGSYGYGYDNGNNNALPRILLGVVPQLLSGNANLGSIFGAVLSGLTQSPTGGYGAPYGGAYGGQYQGTYGGQYQGSYGGSYGGTSFSGQPYSGQYGTQQGTSQYGTQQGYNQYGTQQGYNQYGTPQGNNQYGTQQGTNPYGTQQGAGGQGIR